MNRLSGFSDWWGDRFGKRRTSEPLKPGFSTSPVHPWPYPWLEGELIYCDSSLAITIFEGEPREDGGDRRRMQIGIRGTNAHTMHLNAETIDKLGAAFARASRA